MNVAAQEEAVMTYIPGAPRPTGPLPEVATARQAEVARQLARQHEAREARDAAEGQRARPWWKRLFCLFGGGKTGEAAGSR